MAWTHPAAVPHSHAIRRNRLGVIPRRHDNARIASRSRSVAPKSGGSPLGDAWSTGGSAGVAGDGSPPAVAATASSSPGTSEPFAVLERGPKRERFGDVLAQDRLGAVQIGDRPGHLDDAIEAATRQAHALDGAREDLFGVSREARSPTSDRPGKVRVARDAEVGVSPFLALSGEVHSRP